MQFLIILETVLLHKTHLLAVALRRMFPSLRESRISSVRCRFAGVGRHTQHACFSRAVMLCDSVLKKGEFPQPFLYRDH